MVEDRANGEGVLWVESERRLEQTREAVQQEASCNQQHKSKSDFRACNRVLQALTAGIRTDLPGSAQRNLRSNAGKTPGGGKPKEQAGNQQSARAKSRTLG